MNKSKVSLKALLVLLITLVLIFADWFWAGVIFLLIAFAFTGLE